MKYQVMYNNGTRIRVRSGQAAFTEKEGYGISALLLENNFIKKDLFYKGGDCQNLRPHWQSSLFIV